MRYRDRLRLRFCVVGLIVLLLLAAACLVDALQGPPTPDRLTRLSETEWAQLSQTPAAAPGTLLLNDQPAPQNAASGCYYIPQSLTDEGYSGQLTLADGYELCVPPEAAAQMGDKSALLQSGAVVTLAARRGGSWYPVQVIFTGLPMLSLTTETVSVNKNGDDVHEGQLLYFSGETLAVGKSYMSLRVRGGASRAFDKLGYKLNLYDIRGEKQDLAFGSMRSDDDWILRSLFTDPQKVREMAAGELWNQIAATAPEDDPPTANMEYVELLIDGEYMGLFGLSERLDDKQVSLGAGDILYKYVTYAVPSATRFAQAEELLEFEIQGRGVRIYGLGRNASTLWTPLQTLMATVYTHGFDEVGFDGALGSEDSQSAEAMNMPYEASWDYDELTAILDVENAIDWGFFNQALQLADSDLNNTYVLARQQSDGSYRVQYIPWDMDYSFGTFNDADENHSRTIPQYYRKLRSTYALNALLHADPKGISAQGQARWAQLREGPLSTSNVWQALDEANVQVVNSGAFARDSARWPQEQNDESLTEMKEYIRTRLEFLDEYYLSAAWTEFD